MGFAMQRRSASLSLPLSLAVLALCLVPTSGFATSAPAGMDDARLGMSHAGIQVAEQDPVPDGDVEDPSKLYKVTPSEVDECMKSWDPQTQMSKEEYLASCKSSLQYFPEGPN